MSTVLETPVIHNHKSNFGRYVADCPKCNERYPNGPPTRTLMKRKPVPTAAEKRAAMEAEIRAKVLAELTTQLPVTTATNDIVEAVAAANPIAGISQEQLVEAMRALGTELRRGDPEVERQREEAKNRTQKAKEAERTLVMERIAMIKFEQDNCPHKMDNGLSRIRGQEHNDGMLHEFCTWCTKAFPPRKLSQQERMARNS